jgi:bifunctional non-homologous end joining protein LigD
MASAPVRVGGKSLALSNLDKILYPKTGFTKGQVINFYTSISRYLLPHLKDRPITLKRYPEGVGGHYFYEKNAPSFTPPWIKKFPIPHTHENSVVNYILINDLPSLIWCANMANLELHPFLAKAPHIERPTMVVFDLDPGDGADILKSCEVAFLVKDLLDRLNLKSFVKVSGSKGLHLHVPLNTKISYEASQPFAKSIAQLLEREHSDLIVSEMPKHKRKGKVLVDWSQNSEHKSTVAVYSLRANANGPFVAMPVSWAQLRKALKQADARALFFEPDAALREVKENGDPFAPVPTLKQRLPQPFLALMSGEKNLRHARRADPLDTYRRKRDFTKTAEPPALMPKSSQPGSRKLFVIQKHAASRLHYDFRLEMDGTLKSWAVPKGPPYDLHERRLAMATEDHPMEYAKFEGLIPRGEYGGGTVMVWDIGTYELMDGNYWQGKLHVFLNGKKLKGEWILVKSHNRDEKGNAWFFIKAGQGTERLSQKKEDSSALTGRSMKKIALDGDAVWHSNRADPKRSSSIEVGTDLNLESLPRAPVKFIEPMLADAVAKLPYDSDDWMYEIKLDGYRCLAGKDSRGVRLWSRRQNLFTEDFPGVAQACADLPSDTLIDGEVVALDGQGRMSFNLLQHRSRANTIRFYAFDLLLYRGRSTLGLELSKRRELLAQVVASLGESIQMSESFKADSAELPRIAKQLGFEGVVAKRKHSLYEPGKRSGAWVKYRINKGQELVIGGYTAGNPFDALIVGYYQGDRLHFAAKVRNGFVPQVRRNIYEKFKGREAEECPFDNLPEKKSRTPWALTREEMKNCVWLKPELVAQIEFTEWTPDGHLRHAKFAGLREDKEPQEVVRELS